MNLPTFRLEEFWKKHEFSAKYHLSQSDSESWRLEEILQFADSETERLWTGLSLGYTESPGHPILRAELASLYDTIGLDKVLTLAGAEEGIYCSMRVLVEPGDPVVVVDPCYESLANLPLALGAELTRVSLKPENRWQLDLNEMEDAVRPDTKLIVLNFPHNPTGTVLRKNTLDAIISMARKAGAYIFCDEVYRYLEIEEHLRLPPMADAYERGISLNVMTKSFGLAGVRVGWLASQDAAFIRDVGSYKLYTSICNSSPSEILSIIALRAREKIWGRNRSLILDNLRLLDAFMERNKDRFAWTRPDSGSIALIEHLHGPSADLGREEGILVLPGPLFDLPANYFRIGFGKKSMPDVLERFERSIPCSTRSICQRRAAISFETRLHR